MNPSTVKRSPWFLLPAFLAAVSCGAPEVEEEVTSEVAERIRMKEAGIDSQGRVTGWPDLEVFKVPQVDENGEGREEAEPLSTDSAGDGLFYRLMGRLLGGALKADVIEAGPDALTRLLEFELKNEMEGRTSGFQGQGHAPRGAPVEMAFWLALTDLYKGMDPLPEDDVVETGRGTMLHVDQTSGKIVLSLIEGSWFTTTRELIRFRVSPRITCEAQMKLFKLSEGQGFNPSARAMERLKRTGEAEYTDDENLLRLRMEPAGRGQVMMEMIGPAAGHELPYTLRIHLGYDVDILHGEGESMDLAMRCRSDRPLFASEMPIYGKQIGRDDDGGWEVVVFFNML